MSKSSINELSLELGDIIKLIASQNSDLNNNIYFIDYLDQNIIKLIDTQNKKFIQLGLTDESLDDLSIEGIELLSRSTEKGYARQNNLLSGKWISIQFGGEIPTTINGEITNLEEDMIEISLLSSDKKIYIDFAYKGLPLNLPIETIRELSPPKQSVPESKPEIPPESKAVASPQEEQTERHSLDTSLGPIEEEEEEAEEMETKITDVSRPEERKDHIITADAIQFGAELDDLELTVDVPEEKRRYDIEEQSNDLLDDLLSNIPTAERTNDVVNSLHIMITRFQQLRKIFSVISKDGDITIPDTKGANYIPLSKSMVDMSIKIPWFIPVVKNTKKLYDFDIDEEDANNSISETTLANSQIEFHEIVNQYKTDIIPDGQNKYGFLFRSLNPLLTPFQESFDVDNIIITKGTNVDTNVITDNNGDLFSEVLSGSVLNEYTKKSKSSPMQLSKIKFNMDRYLTGITTLKEIDIKDENKNQQLINITKGDKLSVTGIVTMPLPVVNYSNIYLPETSIYKKAILNKIPFIYNTFINNKTTVDTRLIEEGSLRAEEENEDYLKNTKFYAFSQTNESNDRKNDTYTQFLNKIIPRTKTLFNLIKKYISNPTSYYAIVKELQPFLVFSDDITFKQYEAIIIWMRDEILNYRKTLVNSKEKYISYINYPYSKNIDFKNSYLFNLLTSTKLEQLQSSGNGIQKEYNLSKATTSEFIRNILTLDDGRLFMNALSLDEIELFVSLDIDAVIQEEIENIQLQKDLPDECKNLTISKFYLDIDDLRGDDGNSEVYFDERFDATRYDILTEFTEQKAAMPPNIFTDFLINHLNKNVGLTISNSTQEANALINGRRKVLEGDYAYITDIYNNNYYYIRDDNNTWIQNKELDGIPLDKATFCNLKKECLIINKECGNVSTNRAEIKKQLINDMVEQFADKNTLNNKELLNKLTTDLTYSLNSLFHIKNMTMREHIKYDLYKKKIGEKVQGNEITSSPYSELRELILSQQDFVKKQTDIIRFINKTCRPAQESKNESEFWYYCLETNVKLFPTFFGVLANAFFSGTYNDVVEEIAANQGRLSDDGDKVVDKYSGYTIKNIEFDTSEGYDETGYKLVSRALISDDIGDIIMNTSSNPAKTVRSKDGQMIRNILLTLSKQMHISIAGDIEFIMHNVETTLDGYLPSEEYYATRVIAAKKKGKNLGRYVDVHDEALLLVTLSYFLVITQTTIPTIKTPKTFRGCGPKSFSGYPLQGDGDYSALKYLACVALKLKSKTRPWHRLPKLKRETALETLKKFMEKIKRIVDAEIVTKVSIQEKINDRRKYNEEHKDVEIIPKMFDVNRWTTFLPPLHTINIKGIPLLGDTFRGELLSEMKKGSPEQSRRISILQGKLTLLSLKIQEFIQSAVNKSVLLLENVENEMLLENACCNDGEKITILYFNEKENEILKLNKKVVELEQLYNDIKLLTSPSFIFDPRNTKVKYSMVSKTFGVETIYKAFIHFCKFNSGTRLTEHLQAICGNNKSTFKINDDIGTKIDIMKAEGHNYSLHAFKELMDVVNKKNILSIKLNKIIHSSKEIYEHLLNSQYVTTAVNDTPLVVFIEKMGAILSKNKLQTENDALEDFDIYLSTSIDSFADSINTFIRSNAGKTRNDDFLNVIESWKLRGENIYMSNEDETAYCYYMYTKNMIFNLLKIFPIMIKDQVNHSKLGVPSHWSRGSQKLSETHVKDIQNILDDELSDLNKFYGIESIEVIINKVIQSELSDIIVKLIDLIPFTADIRLKPNEPRTATVINGTIIKKISKYLTLYTFKLYIDNLGTITREYGISVDKNETKIDELEQEILLGQSTESSQQLALLLQTYIKIMSGEKKYLNISNNDINQNVLKSQEKEKAKMTKRLGDLSVDERRVEDIMKNHRLGKWGVGQTKALFTYDETQYDKERQELETDAILENKLNAIDGVTDRLRDIYKMDFLNDEQVERQIQQEIDSDIMTMAVDDDFGDSDD